MGNTLANQLFKEQFKFSINQEVRHKGDSKNGMSSDMGLLIISRQMEETIDGDNNVIYYRVYVCRVIRFGGSGTVISFGETELLSMDEFNEKSVREEHKREEVRNNIYQVQKEIFASFGVKRNTRVYLKKEDGSVDKTNIFRVSGFEQTKEGVSLSLRMEAGEGRTSENEKVKSKDEFQVIPPDDSNSTE